MKKASAFFNFDVNVLTAVKQQVEKVDIVIYRYPCFVGKILFCRKTQAAHKGLVQPTLTVLQGSLVYLQVTKHYLILGINPTFL